MRDVVSIYGKSIKSDSDIVMYVGFPGSGEIQSLPAGRPSTRITSYLPSGYFQLDGSQIGYEKDLYIKDNEDIEIVDPGAIDESTYYSRLNNAIFTTWFNTSGTIQKNLGFLGQGARESFSKLKIDTFDFGRYLNRILILLSIFLVLWIINKLT